MSGYVNPRHGRSFDRPAAAWLAAITLLGLLLRLLYLSSKSFTLDEGFSVYLAKTNTSEFFSTLWHSELNMAPYYALLRAWVHLGSSESAIRLLSVLLGAATIPAVYFVGSRLFGRAAGLFAALLLAVHPFHITLSQAARGYALAILLVSLSTLFFLRMLGQPSAWNMAAYALLSALAIYSQFFAATAIAAQWIALVLSRGQRALPWNPLLRYLAILTALLIPLALFLLHGVHGQISWVEPLTSAQVLSVLYGLTLPNSRCVIYVALWACAIFALVRLHARVHDIWPYWVATSWLVVPFGMTLLMSLLQPAMVPRFLSISIPASVLLAAVGLSFLWKQSRALMALALAATLLLSVSADRFYYRHADLNENWRGATAFVLTSVHAGDEVLVLPHYAHFAFDYYRRRAGEGTPEFVMPSSASQVPANLAGNFWVVRSGFIHDDSSPASFTGYCAQSQDNFAGVTVQKLSRCGQ